MTHTIFQMNPDNICSWVACRRLYLAALRFFLGACFSLLPTLTRAADGQGLLADYFRSTLAEVSAFVDIYAKNEDAGLRNDRVTLWTELSLRNNVALFSSFSLETELNITVTLPNQQSGMFTTPGVINPEPPFIDFRTFMLTWRGVSTEVSLGKGIIELGYAELYTPVDRFSSQNYNKPQHFYDRGDIQLSVSRFFNRSTLKFTVLPYNEDFIDPPAKSRWLNSRDDLEFFNQVGARDEDRPNSFPEDWGYLLLFTGVGNGFDYYLGAHRGQSAYPVVQFSGIVFPPKTRKFYPTATSGMAGIVGTRGSWTYYVDIIHQQTEDYDDDSFTRWAVGFSYRATKLANRLGLVEIKPLLTYSGQKITNNRNALSIVSNSEPARPHPNSLLGRLDLRYTDRALFYLLGSINFTEYDSSFGFGFEYFPSDSLSFSAVSLFMNGKNNTQFGRWRSNDFVSIGLNYRF
jgi:hypothetical protein